MIIGIVVSGEEGDALSFISHRSVAESRARKILQKLRKEIPRHMFEVTLQLICACTHRTGTSTY